MRISIAFLRLIRWPNLLFIALAQFLFFSCILIPILEPLELRPALDGWFFILVVLASILIAAAGYIINDYFDVNIDHVNKPHLNVVDSVISRRWAMLWHFFLSGVGLVLSVYISWRTGLWYIAFANFLCIVSLFAYSISLKKKLLWGNVLISLLTSWVILILCFAEILTYSSVQFDQGLILARQKITRLGLMYAGFAFMISLIREAIKDIEDMPGDIRHGCRTMPIVWGVRVTKVYCAVWLIVIIALVVATNLYVLPFNWWWPVGYSIIFILVPLLYILYGLYQANTPAMFHRLSNFTKLIMLMGILSMSFFYFYL